MFQFPGLPSLWLYIHHRITTHYCSWVPSFGNLWLNGYLLLATAYRSLSRPSSAPSAKASALCPSSLDQKCCLMALIRSSSTICLKLLVNYLLVFLIQLTSINRYPLSFNRKTDIFSIFVVFCFYILILYSVFKVHSKPFRVGGE